MNLVLEETENKVVGLKQVLRAMQNGTAQKVYVAADVEQHIKRDIEQKAAAFHVPLEIYSSMKDLGQVCKIDVKAACVAILK